MTGIFVQSIVNGSLSGSQYKWSWIIVNMCLKLSTKILILDIDRTWLWNYTHFIYLKENKISMKIDPWILNNGRYSILIFLTILFGNNIF